MLLGSWKSRTRDGLAEGRDRSEKTRGDESFPADTMQQEMLRVIQQQHEDQLKQQQRNQTQQLQFMQSMLNQQQQQSQAFLSLIERLAPKESQ